MTGCRGVDDEWNGQDIGNCTACASEGSEWRSYFSWTPARWLTGQMRSLRWVQPVFANRNQWTSTLNFTRLSRDIQDSARLAQNLVTKSETLCRYKRIDSTLNAVACNCVAEGEGECFPEVALLASVGRACAGLASQIAVTICLHSLETNL